MALSVTVARLLLLAALLPACAAQTVSPEKPEELLPDLTASLTPGETGRVGARTVLGEPLFSGIAPSFDLFREGASQSAMIFAVTPIPVPFARIADDLYRYTLVSYDDLGRVSAVASGFWRKPAAWRNINPIERDYPSIHLRAGSILFYADPERERGENLLAASSAREEWLKAAQEKGNCTVVIGCGGSGCPDRLALDGGKPLPLPLRSAQTYWIAAKNRAEWLKAVEPPDSADSFAWLETLAPVLLAPGERVLHFSARHLSGSAEEKVSCRGGELLYLTIYASEEKSFWGSSLTDWRIERSSALPAAFASRPLTLITGGRLLTDP